MCIKIFAIFILWSVFGLFLPAHNKKECWLNSYLRRNIPHGVAVTRSFSNFCDSLCYRFAGKFCRWSTGKSQNWFGKVTDKNSTAFPLNMHFLKSEDLAQYFHCFTLLISFWHEFHITIFFFWFAGAYTMKNADQEPCFISVHRRNSAQSSGDLYTLSLILFLPISFLQSPYLNVFSLCKSYYLNLWYFCHLTNVYVVSCLRIQPLKCIGLHFSPCRDWKLFSW